MKNNQSISYIAVPNKKGVIKIVQVVKKNGKKTVESGSTTSSS